MSIIKLKNNLTILQGIGASPGVAIGQAFLFDHDKVKIIRRHLDDHEIEKEKERFINAVSEAEEQLSRLIAEIPGELKEHASILKSHLLMLKDRMVYDRTLKSIEEEKINAEWALRNSFQYVKKLFGQIKEQYIRERIADVEYVVQRVQGILAGGPALDLTALEEPVILVAKDLSPADTVQMNPDKILAFVTDMGSRTSHTAILARSIGIPAIVGLENATSTILSGSILIADGLCGEVIVDPDEEVLRHYQEKQESYSKYRLDIIHNSHLPAESQDGFRVKVKANIELLEEIPSVISNGAEGVGLFRTEFLYLRQKELPSEEMLFSAYKDVVERLSPYPVTIRTLDIGGDKFVSSISLGEEINPALGLRAVRLCLKELDLFRTQLRAILRASHYGEVRILIPLISGVIEILQVKEYLETIKEELRKEQIPFDEEIKVGIMIEVPTAVVVADLLAKEVDFFSIGTNDLIQYSLAIDRVNEYVAHLYEPLHPGILRMINRTIEAAHDGGIEVAMCGEMAGEPMYVPILVGLGLDELSMNAMGIPRIKRMIRQVSQEECSRLVRELLDASTALEIRKKLFDFLTLQFPDEFDPTKGLYADLIQNSICPIGH